MPASRAKDTFSTSSGCPPFY